MKAFPVSRILGAVTQPGLPHANPELPLPCSSFLFTEFMIYKENRCRCGSGEEALIWLGQDPGVTPITRRGGREEGEKELSHFKKGKRLINTRSDKNSSYLLSMNFRLRDLDKDCKMKARVKKTPVDAGCILRDILLVNTALRRNYMQKSHIIQHDEK